MYAWYVVSWFTYYIHKSDAAYAVRLEPAGVRECLPVNALSLAGAVEEDVGDRHNQVVDDAATSDQAKPVLASIAIYT